MHSPALTRLLARSLRSLPSSWKIEFLMSQNDLVLSHSAAMAVAVVVAVVVEEEEEEEEEKEVEGG